MTSLQLSIVHRLPQNYRWSAGLLVSQVRRLNRFRKMDRAVTTAWWRLNCLARMVIMHGR
uniref:hypothetical protein n=1 Tax=Escherichia coli TaxID=562 RepID=UPI00356B6879